MTAKQRKAQLQALLGSYAIRLEDLYNDFYSELVRLSIHNHRSVASMLTEDPLFRFSKYPELTGQLDNIIVDYVQKGLLLTKAGISDGATLAFSHDNLDLKGFSIYSDHALSSMRKRVAETFFQSRMAPGKGLNLSQLIWNYTSEAKSEFEVAISNVISDGLEHGTSAETLGRRVRQYLNNPDMMYRRYHRTIVDAKGAKRDVVTWRRRIVDEEGRVRFVEAPLEAVGTGQYRSARRNALRMTRTEINMSYHHASTERWQQEPFVTGITISLSPQHPQRDMCDDLAGDYPKDFPFFGWHPQCMCMANPITIQGEEKKEFYRRMMDGEDMSGYVSPNAITDTPEGFKKYVSDNHDAFVRAGERGKLGYIWRESEKFWKDEFSDEELRKMGLGAEPKAEEPQKPAKRVKTQEEREAIQKRWDERKAVNEAITKSEKLLEEASDFPQMPAGESIMSGLKKAMADRDLTAIEGYFKTLSDRLVFERSITPDILLDSTMRKKYGDEAVEQLYANAKRTISSKVSGDIDERIKALRFERDWVLKNRSFDTVKEVAAYYEREAARLEAKKRFTEVRSKLTSLESSLSKYGVRGTLTGDEWYTDTDAMEKRLRKVEKFGSTLERVEKLEEYAKTSKSPVVKSLRDRVAGAIAKSGLEADIDDLLEQAEKAIHRLETERALREKKKRDKVLEKMAGDRVTIEDLKMIYGDDLPATLRELDDAIAKFPYINAELKAREAEINAWMKKLFDENDFGMDINHYLLDSVYENGFYNTFQSGTSNGYQGSRRTTGPIETDHGRLRMAHRMFLPSTHSSLSGGAYSGPQLARREYEKYGHLLDRDKLTSILKNRTHYGDVQVRFKKDKVLATWTFDDSLHMSGQYFQPSLVTDPRVESFDGYLSRDVAIEAGDRWDSVYAWQRQHGTGYIELQYHGKLDISCVESMTFPDNPARLISEELIKKLEDIGIELWYNNGGQLKRYVSS